MYTLEQLQQKNLKELKEIGWQLNVLPTADRRCRQNWIDALVGTQPPLLQLLEVSPVVEVEPVQDAIEVQAQASFQIGDSVNAVSDLWGLEQKSLIGTVILVHPSGGVRVNFGPGGIFDYSRPRKDLIKAPTEEVQVTEPIAQNAETRPELTRTESADVHHRRSHPAESVRDNNGAEAEALGNKEGDRVLAVAGNCEASRGRVLPHQPNELAAIFNDEQPPNRGDGKGRIEPKLSQSAIVQAAKNSPGVKRKTSTAHELLELFKSSAVILDDSPAGETEAELLESAIVPATENLPRSESDLNPILTGIVLSDTFLARYSPPQPETIHYQSDPDGQLSLLNFEVESVDKPPDPDDFPSIDAFNEAMARWDAENSEALMGSMDSMCEWAPCPEEWYEPEPENLPLKASSMREPSEVLELSPAIECSSTCEFLIPVFDAWCDRPNRQNDTDEPPDTGNYAKLPGPKPPKFPPRAITYQSHTKRRPDAGQTQVKHISITAQSHNRYIAAAGSSRLGRDPPGGDVTM